MSNRRKNSLISLRHTASAYAFPFTCKVKFIKHLPEFLNENPILLGQKVAEAKFFISWLLTVSFSQSMDVPVDLSLARVLFICTGMSSFTDGESLDLFKETS